MSEFAKRVLLQSVEQKAEIPDEAIRISDRSEAPEGANIIEGERGGLAYLPEGEDAEGESGGDTADRANPDGTIDVENLQEGDTVLKGGDEIEINGIESDEHGTVVMFTEGGEDFFIYDDLIDADFVVPGVEDATEDAETGENGGDSNLEFNEGDEITTPDGDPATVVGFDPETDVVAYETDDGEQLLTTVEGIQDDDEANETPVSDEFRDQTGLDAGININELDETNREMLANGINEFDEAVGVREYDVMQVTTTPPDDVGAGAAAAYNGSGRTLYMNPDGIDPEQKQRDFDEGFIATETPEGSVYHELVHARHFRDTLEDPDSDLDDLRETNFDSETKSQIENEVSLYASTNATEFVAEVGSAIVEGKEFSDEIMDLYDEFGGPEVQSI